MLSLLMLLLLTLLLVSVVVVNVAIVANVVSRGIIASKNLSISSPGLNLLPYSKPWEEAN